MAVLYGITNDNMPYKVDGVCYKKINGVMIAHAEMRYLDGTIFKTILFSDIEKESKFISYEKEKMMHEFLQMKLTEREMFEFVFRSNYSKLPPVVRNMAYGLMEENEKLNKALDKVCQELEKMSYCKDCYEYQEKGCPFICDGKRCHGECREAEKWKEWCMKDDQM